MSDHKKIISELKKYNQDLEKHVPGLDLDLMKESRLQSSRNEDYYTLFAENLVDMRTEIALMRKNLSADVEGMVLRVVNEQQNRFSQRMNDFFVKAVLDVKETWDTRLSTFVDEISDVKKVFNGMKVENSNLSELVKNINEEILMLKSSVGDGEVKAERKELRNRIEELESLIKTLNKNNNSTLLLEKLESIEKSIHSNNLNSFKSEISKKINKFEDNFQELYKTSSNFTSLKSNITKKLNEVENKVDSFSNQFEEKNYETLNSFKSSFSNKFLDVEKRIDNLSNLDSLVNNDEFNKKVKEIENKISNFSNNFSKDDLGLSSEIENLNLKVDNLNKKVSNSGKEDLGARNKLTELENNITILKKSFDEKEQKNNIKLESLQKNLNSIDIDSFRDSVESKVLELENQINELQSSNSISNSEKDFFNTKFLEIEDKLSSLSNSNESFSNAFDSINGKFQNIQGKLTEVNKNSNEKKINSFVSVNSNALKKTSLNSSKLLEIDSRLSKLNALR